MALPLLGSMRGYRLKMRKGMPGGRSRGASEVPGVVTCGQASAVWHSAVFGKHPGRVSYFEGGSPERERPGGAKGRVWPYSSPAIHHGVADSVPATGP